ncbi:probable phosphoglycerate mutase [Lentzea albidocapillata subsp. violacea]|uniref:Probable phosphoglycerate mutase n=1 Tax=Lentzea albidocapillata subsp. violacea TaxID=128104 RepID=A0A1G9DL24_9PSEU|nr:histidine phosphatase family protein [Lentzea albidocapillata]SDK64603.1 probable phosphoglycerate mutase [Lentzea albidocapillata subsp. violacea]
MRLLLVRHGETASNIERKLDTAMPGPPLTELGLKQARELADTLAGENITAVYASIGLRAQQTAAPTAERFGLPVQVLDGIEEIQVGSLEGRNDTEAYRTYLDTVIQWAEGALDVPFPGGGETGQQVLDRFLGAISTIQADGTVMVVTHGGAGRMGALALASNVPVELAENLLPNTGVVVLESEGAGWVCRSWAGVEI